MEALAVRNEEKGGAMYPLEPQDAQFRDFGARVGVLWPGDPNALYHSEGVQEGFLVLAGECTLVVEEQERPLRQWDYFHCPPGTGHVIVGAGDGPCAILMIGARPDDPIHYSVARSRRSTAHPSRRRPASPTRRIRTGGATTRRSASRGRASRTRTSIWCGPRA